MTDPYDEPPEDYDTGPVLPHDADAERAAIGSALLSADALADVAAEVKPEDFYAPAHERIWAAVLAQVTDGLPVEAAALLNRLTPTDLRPVGGPVYLHTLTQAAISPASGGYYARIVRQHAVNRGLVQAGQRIAQLGYSGGDAAGNLTAAQDQIHALHGPQRATGAMIGELVDDLMTSIETTLQDPDAVPWPYLAEGGYRMPDLAAGRLTIVAGRPAQGKSTCALDAARHVAVRLGLTVAFFSLEMGRTELAARAAAAEAGILLPHVQPGQMTAHDWEQWAKHAGAVADARLWVDDNAHADPAYIRSEAQRLQRDQGLGLVVVDYLQLMESGRRVASREQEISSYSRALKLLAKDLHVPVIAVSQLNRGPEQRNDKKPMMSDLRESGGLEQDADQVILVFREDAYEPESPRAGEVDLIVAKNRNGPTGTVTLAAQLSRARFVDMAAKPWSPSGMVRDAPYSRPA